MAETAITKKILDLFWSAGHFAEKIHGEAMQTRGTPDIFACVGGRFIAIEVKQPGGSQASRGSPLQEYYLERIRQAGGYGAVIDNADDVGAALEAWPNVCPKCFSVLRPYPEYGVGMQYNCPNKHGVMSHEGVFTYWDSRWGTSTPPSRKSE